MQASSSRASTSGSWNKLQNSFEFGQRTGIERVVFSSQAQ